MSSRQKPKTRRISHRNFNTTRKLNYLGRASAVGVAALGLLAICPTCESVHAYTAEEQEDGIATISNLTSTERESGMLVSSVEISFSPQLWQCDLVSHRRRSIRVSIGISQCRSIQLRRV